MANQRTSFVSDDHFYIGIGASAGGLEAIQTFFDHMPSENNFSFIIIQHLSSDFKSLLVELVARHTSMKVVEAQDNVRIRKNCVYVIPNNRFITIRHDRLVLVEKPVDKLPNNAIDVFLHSLAHDKKDRAIAILLSGTGTDGTSGITAIKECGGRVLVQRPDTAKFDGMPVSAIQSGQVDNILAPEAMPEEILSLTPGDLFRQELVIDDSVLRNIFELIQQEAGHDFHYYKTPTLIRRIAKRMRMQNIATPSEYVTFLTQQPSESRTLAKEFLIGVTRFFRDTEAFEVLRSGVLPLIVKEKNDGEIVKTWVCACSTGEEAYSIAILIDQAIAASGKRLDVKIFATDIERASIEIASKGIYPFSIEKDMDAEVLQKYFVRKEEGYQITSRIRKQIVFTQHNVTKDAPFIHNDLVTCRNMLIYLGPDLQKRVYSLLLFSLRKGGYLFLGTSEHATYIKSFTYEVSSKWKIYQKTLDNKLSYYETHQRFLSPAGAKEESQLRQRPKQTLLDHFRDVLVSRFNFAAFFIDKEFDIKEALGNYEKILSVPKKVLRLNLLTMVPSALSSILHGYIKKVLTGEQEIVVATVHLPLDGQDFVLQILVRRPQAETDFILVAFHYTPAEDILATGTTGIVYPDPDLSEYVRSLEQELNDTKLSLQLAVENLETSNEELQSSNEELLSSNEELQSSNEELQSLNEELHTLNTEHQLKIRELTELNDDLNNYFRSSDIAQVFLDKNLTIRKFNAACARMINFIDSDIGRPISHISTNIRHTSFLVDIQRVNEKQAIVEREIEAQSGKHLLMRIMPYLTDDGESSGVVISFVDITTVTHLNNIIRGVFNATPSAFFAFDKISNKSDQMIDLRVTAFNHAASKLTGEDVGVWYGKLLKKDIKPGIIHEYFDLYARAIEERITVRQDVFNRLWEKWFELSVVPTDNGVVSSFTDITQKKLSEEKLKRNYTELIAVKENLNKLNAELEGQVSRQTQMLSKAEERFGLVERATNDVIWDWNFATTVMWWSEALVSKFGYNSNTFTRDDWRSRIHPEDRAGVEESIYEVINQKQQSWRAVYRFQKSDGTYTQVLDRANLVRDENNIPYRFVGSMLDLEDVQLASRHTKA